MRKKDAAFHLRFLRYAIDHAVSPVVTIQLLKERDLNLKFKIPSPALFKYNVNIENKKDILKREGMLHLLKKRRQLC